MKKFNKYIIVVLPLVLMFTACTISYKFTGSSIDYTKIKSISIADFPNNADLVYPPLSQEFTEALKDKFSRQTRLNVLRTGGDLQITGEIVGYQESSMAVSTDYYAAQTKLTLTISVSFTNTKNPDESFEDKKYSAYQVFDNTQTLSQVQADLVTEMISEIVDQIFNDTAAKW